MQIISLQESSIDKSEVFYQLFFIIFALVHRTEINQCDKNYGEELSYGTCNKHIKST